METARELPRPGVSARTKRMLLVVASVVIAVGVMSLYYRSKATNELEEFSLHYLGLSKPTINRLADGFVDADGDLVADAPESEADWLDPDTLAFCYVPDPDTNPAHWDALLKRIAEVTGKETTYQVANNFSEQLLRLKEGELHIAGVNTGGVARAVNVAGFVPMVSLANENGEYGYKMKLVVPSSSSIQQIEDLRDRRVTFTSTNSNSGFKAPLMLLYKDYDMLPNRDYQFSLSTSHDTSIEGLVKGHFEVIAVASDILQRAVERGTISESSFRVIYESQRFPSASIGVSHRLHPELRAQILKALTEFDVADSDANEVLGSDVRKFVPVDFKEDWELLRRTDDALGVQHSL